MPSIRAQAPACCHGCDLAGHRLLSEGLTGYRLSALCDVYEVVVGPGPVREALGRCRPGAPRW